MIKQIVFKKRIIKPSKVVCVGRNYVEHIKELNNATPSEPVIFIKPNSAITSELNITSEDEIHFESELAFLIENGELVGVGFGLDLTKRQKQHELKSKGLPWERAKAFDQSAVFSDFVAIPYDINSLRLELMLNDQIQQQGGCSMMMNSPQDLVKEINSFMTLEDGDILMTGTPSGVGQIQRGDFFVGRIYSGHQLLVEVQWQAKFG